MRLSPSIIAALATAPIVSASGKLGYALGDKKADGTCKFKADYVDDFTTLSTTSKLVRIYAASDCNTAAEILPAAEEAGFMVILGIWYVLHPLPSWFPLPRSLTRFPINCVRCSWLWIMANDL
jgi:glucan 1,3-beta-glucosidase